MTTTDWIGLVGDVFTGLAGAGAAISAAFAWKSIQKANDTAKILDSMAVTLKESERTVFRMMSARQSMSEGLTTAMTYAQRLRVDCSHASPGSNESLVRYMAW